MFRYQFLAIVTIIGLIIFNHWLFATFFDTNYLLWYLQSGSFIGFGLIFISQVSKNFNKDVDTVSVDPLTYVLTYLLYLAVPIGLIGTLMRVNAGLSDKPQNRYPKRTNPKQVDTTQPETQNKNKFDRRSMLEQLIDGPLFLVWVPVILLAPFLWILIVVPPQYFVFLICGAPARYMNPIDIRAAIVEKDGKKKIDYINYSDELRSDSQELSLGIEPFPLTNLLSILFFETVKFFVVS